MESLKLSGLGMQVTFLSRGTLSVWGSSETLQHAMGSESVIIRAEVTKQGVWEAKVLPDSARRHLWEFRKMHCSGSKAFVMASLHLGYQMHSENKSKASLCLPVAWRVKPRDPSHLRLLPSQGQREGTANALEIPTCQKITLEIEMV